MRNDYEDPDFEDGEEDAEDEWSDLDPEEREELDDMSFYNEIASQELTNEMAQLNNRELCEFMTWELDRVGFEKYTQTVFLGFEFTNQYVLHFYNSRENQTTKMTSGAGNIYALIDSWFKKTVSELMIEQLFGGLQTVTEEDMIDVNTNMLLDLVEWKQSVGLDLMKGTGEELESRREE